MSEVQQQQHALQNTWAFWFLRRVQGVKSQESYEKNIKKIGSFATVEAFWSYYNHLIRPSELPVGTDYHLFKEGIKPMWEDDANKQGGKMIIRLRKGLASRCWEELILAAIGEQFQDVNEEICGLFTLQIWTKSAYDKEAKSKIYETVKSVFGSIKFKTEYKPHTASLSDNSNVTRKNEALMQDPERSAESRDELDEDSSLNPPT